MNNSAVNMFYSGKPVGDIAAIFGVTPKTVYQWLNKAGIHLKKRHPVNEKLFFHWVLDTHQEWSVQLVSRLF